MKTISTIRGIAMTALTVLALAACSGSTASPASQAPAATTAAATTEAPAATVAATQVSAAPITTAAATEAPAATSAPAAQAATHTKLNLNTATEEQLMSTIPNMGSRMVREFFEYRPYSSIQVFRKEIGKYVDAAQVSSYEQYVYVPISADTSDSATIQQIPGVDASTAEALIAARPFNNNTAFLSKLAELAPSVDQSVAESYLAQ